jgi:hypothetical protein
MLNATQSEIARRAALIRAAVTDGVTDRAMAAQLRDA